MDWEVMKIESSCADKVYEILTTCISCPSEVIEMIAEVNGVDKDQRGKRSYLITMCIDEMRQLGEEYFSEPDHIIEMPWVTYREAARASSLDSHERLNLDRTMDQLDALFDDEFAVHKVGIDWDVLAKVMEIQIKMEEVMRVIDYVTNPVFERRDIQRRALDRHMKSMNAWKAQGRSKEHYKRTQLLMKANTRARETAMAAGREDRDPFISSLWDQWNEYRDQCRSLVGWDTRYYGLLASIAPFVPSSQPHHIKREVRVSRAKWLSGGLERNKEHRRKQENQPITPYWITREADEVYDDYAAHSESLNRGEDMRDLHMEETVRNEWKDVNRDFVPVNTGMRVLHRHTSQVRNITERYRRWIAAPSRIKI
jgi:hypothetical protein